MTQIPQGSESQAVELLVALLTWVFWLVYGLCFYTLAGVGYGLRALQLLYLRGQEFQRDPQIRGRVAESFRAVRSGGAALLSGIGSVGVATLSALAPNPSSTAVGQQNPVVRKSISYITYS